MPASVELPTHADTALAAVGLIETRCSSTLIDVGGADDAPAYVLTAGHCTGLEPILYPYVIDAGPADGGVIHFGAFVDAAPIDATIAQMMYESMDGTDLGIYRLDATIGSMRARGVAPIALADAPPATGAPITIASYPMEVPEDPKRVLHASHCDEDASVRLAEGPFVFLDFLANDCAWIRAGSSGGAFLDEHGRLFAVLSTQADPPTDGQPPCWLNVPCELDGGVHMRVGETYGAPIRSLASCFTGGVFDLDAPGCSLTRTDVPSVAPIDGRFTDDAISKWQVAIADHGLPYYRIKQGAAADVRCDEDTGYGAPIAIADRPLFDDPITSAHPRVLCIQGLAGLTPQPATRFLERTIMLVI